MTDPCGNCGASPTTVGTPPAVKTKTHFILVLDCSPSMSEVRAASPGSRENVVNRTSMLRLIQEQLATLRGAVDMEQTITAYRFQSTPTELMFNRPVNDVSIDEGMLPTGGGTAIRDAICAAGRRAMCDGDPAKAFAMLVITDGEENSSRHTQGELADFIRERQATGRWTFAFLVPPGGKREIVASCSVPADNVKEWANLDDVRTKVTQSTEAYLNQRRAGATRSVSYFVTDLSKVTSATLMRLHDVTSEIKLWTVGRRDKPKAGWVGGKPIEWNIMDYVNAKTRGKFKPGVTFFEFMKKEKRFAGYKKLLIRDKATGRIYTDGAISVRKLLGLSDVGHMDIEPGNHAGYDLLGQSTSTNRILPRGTKVVYWSKAVK